MYLCIYVFMYLFIYLFIYLLFMNLFLPSAPLQRSFTMLPYIFLYTFTVFLHSIPLGYPSTSFLQYFFSSFFHVYSFFFHAGMIAWTLQSLSR